MLTACGVGGWSPELVGGMGVGAAPAEASPCRSLASRGPSHTLWDVRTGEEDGCRALEGGCWHRWTAARG